MYSGFRSLAIGLTVLFTLPAFADQLPSAPVSSPVVEKALVEPKPSTDLPQSPSSHRFFDKKNAWLFTGIAVTRALDYTSTINMQARGREELLLPDDVVNNRAAFAAVEAGGAATSIGISYLLHRTGHHKLERWFSITHISVTGFGAARNYALKSKHP